MKKPLSHKTAWRNFNSIHKIKVKYERKYEGKLFSETHNCTVTVTKSGKTLYDFNKVPISIVHYPNHSDSRSGSDWYRFNIYWEDADISDYNEKGLFGYYDTDFSNTILKNGEIYITSSNGKKLLVELPGKIQAMIES